MNIDENVKDIVTKVIFDRFPEGTVKSVSFESITVSDDGASIEIIVVLGVGSEPDAVADRYFGLTGKVREALGETWRDYFPIIRPVFGQEEYA